MKVKVTITKEIDSDEILVGDRTLTALLDEIHLKTLECVQDISINRQRDIPDWTDIDAPLYSVLNLIEKVQKT